MKKKINILLVCGSGASSSFMAAKMRMAAKKRDLDISVTARAEGEIVNFIDDVDAVMIGPHLFVDYERLKENYGHSCAVILMDKDYYSKLDGDKALDHLERELKDLHGNGANDERKNP